MADRKEASRILGELPAQDLKAVEELGHWHESVGVAEGFKPEERAQRLALIEETAQPRLRKLEREYLAAARGTRGSRAQENLLWTRNHDYWRHAGQAQARCVEAVIQAGKGAEKNLAPVATAAVRALAQQLKWQHLRYGPIDATVWGLMNRIVAAVEARVAEVKREYLKAALFSAAAPDSLLAPELELAERLVGELSSGFALSSASAPEYPYWIDLGKAMTPARGAKAAQPAAGVRYIGPGGSLEKVRTWSQAIQVKRQVPSELKFVADADPEMLLHVLQHLGLNWAPEPPERKHKRHSMNSKLRIAHGFDGVMQALGGAKDSLDFGAQEAAETWAVENVSAGGFGAIAPQAKSEWLKVGALVAVQPDGAPGWLVGTVRRVSKVSNQEIRVGVETLSRTPSLSQFATRNNAQTDGVLLPAAAPGATDPAIALRAGVYVPGQNLEAKVGDRQHVYMPLAVTARGEDYEIVRFREMIRDS